MLDDARKTLLKDLFGKPQRIVLTAWILQRDGLPFFLAEAAAGVRPHVSDSNLTYELSALVDHGLLHQYQDGRRNYYTVLDHPLWRAFEAVSAATGLEGELRATLEAI